MSVNIEVPEVKAIDLTNYNLSAILKELNLWCMNWNGNINAVYGNEVTILEKLQKLFWVVKTTVASQENVTTAFVELEGEYQNLRNFVNDYFNNLDLQEEVNKKLDEMTNDKYFETYLNSLFAGYTQPTDQKINVIQEQIKQLQTNPPTENTELQDIRISFTGKTYSTAGESVRETTKNIAEGNLLYPEAIKGEQTEYFEYYNIFDSSTVILNTAVYPTTGNIYAINNFFVTPLIRVKEGKFYYRNLISSQNYAFYDINGVFMDKRSEFPNNLLPVHFQIPAGVSYVRFSGNIDTEYVNKGYICTYEKWYPHELYTTDKVKASSTFLPSTLFPNTISCWGDSLVAGAGATDVIINGLHGATLPSTIAHLLKYNYPDTYNNDNTIKQVLNFGVGGENTVAIMARQGTKLVYINNIVIPATGSVTFSKVYDEKGNVVEIDRQNWKGQRWAWENSTINGIKVKLTYTNNMYTLTRLVNGESAVSVEYLTPLLSGTSNRNNDICVFEIGHNGGWENNYNVLVEQYKCMINYNNSEKYVIIGDSDGSSTSKKDWENALDNSFGSHFINIRKIMTEPIYDESNNIINCRALKVMGITPTESDINNIKNGVIPLSLKNDSTHYNSYGYYFQGTIVVQRLKDLKYI